MIFSTSKLVPWAMLRQFLRPRSLILAGLCLLIGGFVYDVAFAGIPSQDPTPELAANYAFHAGVASAIRWCGAILLLAAAVRWIYTRLGNRQEGTRH